MPGMKAGRGVSRQVCGQAPMSTLKSWTRRERASRPPRARAAGARVKGACVGRQGWQQTREQPGRAERGGNWKALLIFVCLLVGWVNHSFTKDLIAVSAEAKRQAGEHRAACAGRRLVQRPAPPRSLPPFCPRGPLLLSKCPTPKSWHQSQPGPATVDDQ